MRNPFSEDVFFDQQHPGQDVDSLNVEALGALRQELPSGEPGSGLGRALVLNAPRAGYGKTHLVSRFAEGLAGRAFVIPLSFDLEKPPCWATLLWDVLEKLHHDHALRPGLTVLDETARFLFARVNQRLIQERKIPCAHPEEAVAALDRNYLEMFDFTNPEQEVARWFGSHFESLAPLSAEVLAPQADLSPSRTTFWLRVLCAYAQGAAEAPETRLEALRWAVNTSDAAESGDGGGVFQESGSGKRAAKHKLRDFGRLLGLHRPLVFVLDHLDVFYRDGQTGLRLAYFISELRRLLPGSLSVLCVNQDLWQATFAAQLPSALEDRLTGAMLMLRGVTREQAEALLKRRLTSAGSPPEEANAFVARAGLGELFAAHPAGTVSPRVLFRWASTRWRLDHGQLEASSREPVPARLLGDPLPAPASAATEALAAPAPVPPPAENGPFTSEEVGPPPEVIPASSVVGDDTLDSISAALQAMSDGVEPTRPPVVPPATEGADASKALWRLRERLDRLRPETTTGGSPKPAKASAAAAVSGVGTVVHAGLGLRPPDEHAWHHASANEPLPVRAFLECLRHRTSAPVAPALDLERIGQLLRFIGGHSPVVKATELTVPGTAGQALQWISPDAEILVGLEASTRAVFWSALTAHAQTRAKLNGGLPVKVVGFVERQAPPHPARAAGLTGGYALDLIEPTATDLSVLAAAGDLFVRFETGELEADPADLAALLTKELDPFWRRLTRLPTRVMN